MRFELPNHIHELTFSCFKRLKLLSEELFCIYLADAVNLARQRNNFALLAYVIMPNHVHLLILPQNEEYSIAKILKSVKQSCARRALRYLRNNNPGFLKRLITGQKNPKYRFWMDGPGYDRNIITIKALRYSIDYIHNNPVRANLVDSPALWKWSSFKAWYYGKEHPIKIDMEKVPIV
ncbi:MAG TPA: hypothetical protein ENO22_02455 [candidate division Zixibacteria bacterium]|nr:hypothetical protein [candidate division Zixibacteria bacterium]